MREESLLCEIKRAWVTTTNSRHSFRRFPNLIKNVAVTGPHQIWASDITYIRIASGFVYLAVILDTYSRKVIGYAISKSLDTTLALHALTTAISQRKPPPGCIHHSDQGVQYASEAYTTVLNTHRFHISMSGKGNPYDNAMAESFFKTLKQEEVYLWDYETFEDVIQRIPYFIEQVYNQKRLHSSLDYVPPDEFEQAFYENHQREACQDITK
jgi:transposase InsO family protein